MKWVFLERPPSYAVSLLSVLPIVSWCGSASQRLFQNPGALPLDLGRDAALRLVFTVCVPVFFPLPQGFAVTISPSTLTAALLAFSQSRNPCFLFFSMYSKTVTSYARTNDLPVNEQLLGKKITKHLLKARESWRRIYDPLLQMTNSYPLFGLIVTFPKNSSLSFRKS